MTSSTTVRPQVFARIASTPLPRPGDRVTLPYGQTGVVQTAKPAGDLRDAKCVVALDLPPAS